MPNEEPDHFSEMTPNQVRAFADDARALFAQILNALGLRHSAHISPADLLAAAVSWLALLLTMRRFREGDAAIIWLDARRIAWERCGAMYPETARKESAEQADAAVADFYQRFPPSLDTRDEELEALRQEVDGLRAIADAAEERAEKAGAEVDDARRAFEWVGVDSRFPLSECVGYYADYHARQLRAADEIKASLIERAEKAERELAETRANLHGNKAAARWLVQQFDVPADVEHSAQFEWMAAEYRRVLSANQSLGWELEDAKRNAMIPLPKPERVEPGQRWAFVMTARGHGDMVGRAIPFAYARGSDLHMQGADFGLAYYLGPAPTSEG